MQLLRCFHRTLCSDSHAGLKANREEVYTQKQGLQQQLTSFTESKSQNLSHRTQCVFLLRDAAAIFNLQSKAIKVVVPFRSISFIATSRQIKHLQHIDCKIITLLKFMSDFHQVGLTTCLDKENNISQVTLELPNTVDLLLG